MGAPQIIYLVFTALGLLSSAFISCTDSQKQSQFALDFFAKACTIGLLFWGGFFGGG